MTRENLISDVIIHTDKMFTQTFLLLNRKPVFAFEESDKWLIAEDNGFFKFYYYEKPVDRSKAFGGHVFDIPLKNGDVIKASGQWWGAVPKNYVSEVDSYGYGTIDSLSECYVFGSVYVQKGMVEKWLEENEPSNNYNKYNHHHADHRKHTIPDKWATG